MPVTPDVSGVPATTLHTLPDGRALTMVECGDPDGVPCIFLHGNPGSRFGGVVMDEAARRNGVRLICPDRAGFGGADPAPGQTLGQAGQDIRDLTDLLGLQRVALFGLSAGGSFALAAAHALQDRATVAVISAGQGPGGDPEVRDQMPKIFQILFNLAQRSHRLAMWFVLALVGISAPLERRAKRKRGDAPPPTASPADADVMRQLADHPATALDQLEIEQRSVREINEVGILLLRPWDFRVEDIHVPVELWYGQDDVVAPPGMAHVLARHLHDVEVHIEPGGHLMCVNHLDEIFATIVDRSSADPAAGTSTS